MEKSEEIKNLVISLAKFQGEVKEIKKDLKNEYLKYSYASLDSIIDSIKEPLSKNNIAFTQIVNNEGVNTILMHTSGEFISTGFYKIQPQQTKGLSLAQVEGVAITYTKRYQLSSILGLNADPDTDGQHEKENEPKYKENDIKNNDKKWLNPNTEKWKEAIDYLVNDKGSIDEIKKKYLISKENEQKLLTEAQKLF